MSTREPDRRQRKSRAALRQALLTLVAEKRYDAITIEDVTEEADVARATFYAHFKDKAALLREASHELITGLTERLPELARPNWPVYDGAAVIEIFRHAEQSPALYLLVVSGEGGTAARNELIDAFRRAAEGVFASIAREPAPVPRPLTTTAFVGALLLTLEAWLRDEHRSPASEMAVEFLNAQVRGLEWCLGLEPGQGRYEAPGSATG